MAVTAPQQRSLLDPATLSGLRSLELVAKSVVEGLVMGLHRSPRLGFSQEFAEYRAYNEGDDSRFVDWGVYGRTDKMFIRQFKGETNTQLAVLLDTSASMGFNTGAVSKLDYGRYLAASLAWLANRQHDAVGALTFSDDVLSVLPPSTRNGQLQAFFEVLNTAQADSGTNFHRPFEKFQSLNLKRGMVAIISDFYCDAQALLKAIRPLAWQGQDIILFHVLDDAELQPSVQGNVLLEDIESGEAVEVDSEYLSNTYPQKLSLHFQGIEKSARGLGADYLRISTSEPLDQALRRYLRLRERRG